MENIVIYLSIKRGFIFLDEWLSYYLLYQLWNSSNYYMFSVASVLAIAFNGYGYKSYWAIEDRYNEYLINKIKGIDKIKEIDK